MSVIAARREQNDWTGRLEGQSRDSLLTYKCELHSKEQKRRCYMATRSAVAGESSCRAAMNDVKQPLTLSFV